MEINRNGIVAEQKCKRIERRDPDSLRLDPNKENWKETSRNKETDGNRRKTRKGQMTEQSRRQRKETERMGIVIEHTERGREQAGMSQEGRRMMEKVLENTVRDTTTIPCTRRSLQCFTVHPTAVNSQPYCG